VEAERGERAAAPVASAPATSQSDPVTHADGHEVAAARPPRPPKEKHKPSPAEQEANRHFMDLVEAMEAALAQGQLHIAAEHDKTLKESKTGRLTPAQAERLAHVRADLKRLGDWARWGGNVSREELVHAVESLPAEGLGMSELAKKVGSMRERWKALDGVSGAAPKSLWEKFDAACTAAYAPAAAHFKHLADERHANAAKAQQLVDEANALIAKDMAQLEAAGGAQVDREESASGNLPHTHDWRTLASSTQRLRQAWSRLGTIDRKDKKRLDAAFSKAMDTLMAPLDAQRKIEVARREQLIEEVGKLNPLDRHTIDTLRRLQESWQGHARALPLERKTEQALWQKFRAACDLIFAKRKEHAHAADHERKAHLHAREAICAGLETATFEGDDKAVLAAIGKALKDAAAAWHASGVVPRASEQKIDQRYRAAVGALQSQADAIRKRAGAAQANALREKLRLVQALESALAESGEIDSADWNSRWQALAALPAEQERTLRSRFDAALKAAGEGAAARVAYAGQLETNRQRLLSEVLRLEIVAGIDSGAEFAKDRLKMQVEVLQSSLKSGQKPASHAAQFLALCAMPALVDARTASRIEQLFRKIGAEGK
jgi:microcompartment protein CcmL/EutN